MSTTLVRLPASLTRSHRAALEGICHDPVSSLCLPLFSGRVSVGTPPTPPARTMRPSVPSSEEYIAAAFSGRPLSARSAPLLTDMLEAFLPAHASVRPDPRRASRSLDSPLPVSFVFPILPRHKDARAFSRHSHTLLECAPSPRAPLRRFLWLFTALRGWELFRPLKQAPGAARGGAASDHHAGGLRPHLYRRLRGLRARGSAKRAWLARLSLRNGT